MSREFRFSSHRLLELLASAKCPVKESELKWKDRGSSGKELRLALDLVDGPFAGFVLYLAAGDVKDVTTYRAALILEGERVRGVDYSSIRRRRFYKAYIERGWHENLIDPNLPTADTNQNQHRPLPDFQPTHLNDFLRKVCRMWQIEFEFEEGLL